ncbi:hypothetical protein [Spirosoma sp.]|uniref:hypothetical protein n=1 Tax=Spirosoma sp. TaxID=1899569 RepID=UPI003B3BBE51
MKYVYSLALSVLIGCIRQEQPQAVSGELAGSWQGVYETEQIGSCAWSGDASVPTTATFQVTSNTVTGKIMRGSASQPISGSLSGNTVQINEVNNTICYGVFGSYTARYKGLIDGNTLTLTSRDTLCPTQGCIFLRTLKLTRQ